MPSPAAISLIYHAMTAQPRTCVRSRYAGKQMGLTCLTGGGWGKGLWWVRGTLWTDYGKSRNLRPSWWSCTYGVPTDSGPCVDWDGFGVEVDVAGESRLEGHWQALHPRWREMSAASCHVVFVARWKTQNHKSGAPGWTSLSHQHWSDLLRQTFSVAAVAGLTLTLSFSCCTFILFLCIFRLLIRAQVTPYS